MFVQIIQAQVVDRDGIEGLLRRWTNEVKPGAEGYLGMTGGITADGRLIQAVRFTDRDAARRSSDRPEQGAWWDEYAKCLSDAVFHDCQRVYLQREGSDQAGFVQFIQGRTTDTERVIQLMGDSEAAMAQARPDVMGVLVAVHDDDPAAFTQVVWFTSEAAAREGEARESPADADWAAEFGALLDGDLTYWDITDPVYD